MAIRTRPAKEKAEGSPLMEGSDGSIRDKVLEAMFEQLLAGQIKRADRANFFRDLRRYLKKAWQFEGMIPETILYDFTAAAEFAMTFGELHMAKFNRADPEELKQIKEAYPHLPDDHQYTAKMGDPRMGFEYVSCRSAAETIVLSMIHALREIMAIYHSEDSKPKDGERVH